MHAVRDDLADVELADRVFAPHYAKAMPRLLAAAASLRVKPSGEHVADLPQGSTIDLFDISGGWAWVRSPLGVGYIPADAIGPA